MLVREHCAGVSNVTRGDCGDSCKSEFFPRKPSAQILGSLGTQEQHAFSEEVKGDAGRSSWHLHCVPSRALQQCFAAYLLCLSRFISGSFLADMCAVPPPVSGSSRQTPERRGRGLVVPPWFSWEVGRGSVWQRISWLGMWLRSQALSAFKAQLCLTEPILALL